jgi:ABC-type oligopeptide transport system substrate-binding subunit
MNQKGRKKMKRLYAVTVAVFALAAAGSTGALAGEVKGPPTGGAPNTNDTAAPDNSHSLCAYSGLNDYVNGQTDRQTQTPKDAAPGSAAHGWTIPDGNGGFITISCNPNGVVG